MAESDLSRAQDEYGSATSPYAALSDYLMQRPVYDRGTRADPVMPTMRVLEATQPDTESLLSEQYKNIMAEQAVANEAASSARQAEINALRDSLREELASSEDAALSQRSDLTKSLEGRIDELRRGVDAETLDLRQAGLDERAALARQIEEGDKLVRQAQEAAIGDLSDRQGSLIGDLKTRIESLSGDLTDINSVIDQSYSELLQKQESSEGATQDQITEISQELNALGGTQSEIDALNQQLETLYADVDSGNAAQSDEIRNETANLISGLEEQIGGLSENLSALPIESIQGQLASLNDQTAQFQSAVTDATSERTALAQQIAALEAAGVSREDLQAALQGRATTDDLAKFRGDYEATGKLVEEALQSGVKSRGVLQQQIEALRGQMPQEVDVDALRKQITDEIMAQMGQQGGGATAGAATGATTGATTETTAGIPAGGVNPNVSAGITAGGGGYTGTSTGSTYEPEAGAYSQYATTEGAAEMGATPYFDTAGIGSEMAQGQFDPSGVDFNAGAKLTQQQGQGSQSLLDQFNNSQAASDFGLSATFDPETGKYVTDVGGFGFTGDQRYKYQTPEEFAAQFEGKKDTQQAAVAPPPAIQGGAPLKKPPMFNPAAFKPENMRFR